MRYLVEFKLPGDFRIQSSLKEREAFLEGSVEAEEDVEDGRTTQQEGELIKHAYRYCTYIHVYVRFRRWCLVPCFFVMLS